MISFETSVRVERPTEDVFDFVSDPLLFPRWNSAVQAVNHTSGVTGEVGSTYSMRRELPTGHVENDLEVLVRERPSEFVIRTTSGPTPFLYQSDSPPKATAPSFTSRPASSCPVWQAYSGRSRPEPSGEASTRTSPHFSEFLRRPREMHNPPRRELRGGWLPRLTSELPELLGGPPRRDIDLRERAVGKAFHVST